ncbi:MAG: GtrA family protein [Pseudomonadota bacterium]
MSSGGEQRSGRSPVQHWAGFLASGAIAFTVDAGVLAVLTRGLGIDPFLARLAAIAVAMVAGWLAHRRLTFAVTAPPTLAEFASYATLAWSVAAFNYAVYAAVLLLAPGTDPILALVVSSLAAMTASYLGMRLGVFRKRRAG